MEEPKDDDKKPAPKAAEADKKEEEPKVEHVQYHDYSQEVEPSMAGVVGTSENGASVVGDPCRGEQNFPVKLHYMLSDLANDGLGHIISWQPHGRCFVVHRQDEFVQRILPLWFRQSKFASFQRQLNLYGFKRISAGRDKGGYYHELFLRGKRFLSRRIQRQKIKGRGARKPSSPETEPNFYLVPYLPPEQTTRATNNLSSNMMPMPLLPGANGAVKVSDLPNNLALQNLLASSAALHPFQQQTLMPNFVGSSSNQLLLSSLLADAQAKLLLQQQQPDGAVSNWLRQTLQTTQSTTAATANNNDTTSAS